MVGEINLDVTTSHTVVSTDSVRYEATSVEVSGELDLATTGALRSALTAAVEQGEHVRVDLSGVTFIDASGLAALVAARSLANARQVTFAVVAASARVRRVLALTGLDRELVWDVYAPS